MTDEVVDAGAVGAAVARVRPLPATDGCMAAGPRRIGSLDVHGRTILQLHTE